MKMHGYSEDELMNEVRNDAQKRFMAFQVDRARKLFIAGAGSYPTCPIRSRDVLPC